MEKKIRRNVRRMEMHLIIVFTNDEIDWEYYPPS
jgi:hypothetical protein